MTDDSDPEIPDFESQQYVFQEMLEELEMLATAFESAWMARSEDEWHINRQRAEELQEVIDKYRGESE